jgi:hypothetical protein
MKRDKCLEFSEDELGAVRFKERICVPRDAALREEILTEGHDSKYCIHLGSMKIYADLKKLFWWKNMKRDITGHVARCDTCNGIKAEHQRHVGLLKPLDFLMLKWVSISMDFIVGLP